MKVLQSHQRGIEIQTRSEGGNREKGPLERMRVIYQGRNNGALLCCLSLHALGSHVREREIDATKYVGMLEPVACKVHQQQLGVM